MIRDPTGASGGVYPNLNHLRGWSWDGRFANQLRMHSASFSVDLLRSRPQALEDFFGHCESDFPLAGHDPIRSRFPEAGKITEVSHPGEDPNRAVEPAGDANHFGARQHSG